MEERKAVLIEKLENELEKYKSELLREKPEVIYENSYKTTCFQEIKDALSYTANLSDFEIKTLSKRDNILETFYDRWINSDGSLRESLEFCVDDVVDELRDLAVKENRQKSKLGAR
ncbi:MAG: DUF3848 domain-containing protein [Clostridia bacterium]|nr:DUF3848 domain-containing protein [Clostridia bacterium]